MKITLDLNKTELADLARLVFWGAWFEHSSLEEVQDSPAFEKFLKALKASEVSHLVKDEDGGLDFSDQAYLEWGPGAQEFEASIFWQGLMEHLGARDMELLGLGALDGSEDEETLVQRDLQLQKIRDFYAKEFETQGVQRLFLTTAPDGVK